MNTSFRVVHGDITTTECDVLVMKYAQGFHAADRLVASALGLVSSDFHLEAGQHRIIPSQGLLPCKNVLFYGVGEIWDFSYAEIRSFATQAMETLKSLGIERSSVAMTMHGVNRGLDEREAFTAQIAGLLAFLMSSDLSERKQGSGYFASGDEFSFITGSRNDGGTSQITIVEREPDRAQRLTALLKKILFDARFERSKSPDAETGPSLPDAGVRSDQKRHVFVAMPFSEDMEDVYEFGIREAVNEAGCLCERCDQDIFTGDILDRVRSRIASANVVVADLTGANPNVYLEVGYAWGKDVPTLLIARHGEELKFDVKGHKCVYYKNISHLRKQLVPCMEKLLSDGRKD